MLNKGLQLRGHVDPCLARKQDPAHFHFDVRLLCRLDNLRWLSLSDAQALTDERSMHRQFYKLQALRERLLTR